MRTSIAFFAGIGTVAVAIAAGLGGGLLIADIMSPQASRQDMTRVDRRASPAQKDVAGSTTAANDPLTPVPYLAAIQPAANAPVVVAPAPQNPSQPSSPQNDASNSTQQAAQPASTIAASDQAPKSSDASPSKPMQAAQPEMREQAMTVDDANAKARDADQKRLADKRKADRRQQWTDRRRYQQRDDELRDVEQKVREDSGRRDYIERQDIERQDDGDRPVRMGFPRTLFGPE